MAKVSIRSAYDDHPRVKSETVGPSRTKQSFKDECDINVLMKKYQATGVLPPGVGVARYADFSDVGDYLEAQITLLRAQDQFDSLPARVRDRFKNDPVAFLTFVANPANLGEARELGLLAEESGKAEPAAPAIPPA